ncbi:MAG TPA: gliding motility-associated C-terminal domain-containing protein [Bacteroidia bacterium]
MKSVFKYIALFFCFGSFAQTLTPPQIGCVSVLPNGYITITWQVIPGLGGQFLSYEVYTSPIKTATPYTLQASIPTYNTNSWTITTLTNTSTQPYYIYIETINSSSVTLLAVDTMRTLNLSVSGANTGIANLTWSGLSNPLPAGEASSYIVYKEYPVATGTWTPIASVPIIAGRINYTYSDTITVCHDTINYKIELADNAPSCTSVSNIAGGWFKNKNKPSVPRIDSVSFINNGTQVVMGISPAYSQDVKCFIIYTYSASASTYDSVTVICNNNQATTYTYTGTIPANGSIALSAISEDSCGNRSQFPNNLQSTIYTHVSPDFCKKTNNIMWTPYQNMVTGVNHYEVFYSTTGGLLGSFQHLGDTTATTYYHRGILPGTNYCYFVRAHSNGKTKLGKDTASSTSNQFCLISSNPPISHYAYLSNVTVNAQQNITVQWHVDTVVSIGGFNLYRATNKSSAYSLVSFIPPTNRKDNIYTDGSVNTNSQEYFYYIQVLDTCLNPTIQTDTSNSIVLKAVPSGNLTATLNWNSYAKYLGGVSGYNIYRSVNGDFVTAATGVSGTTFVDDLSPFATDEGVFIYYVEAIEGPGNPYSLIEISRSNYDTVYIDANLYIPNAFTPHGKNKVFLPIGAYIDANDYKLSIYNRWGEKIHETTDPNKGWDGGGHEEGVYAYTVQYKTAVGEFRQRNGTVNLIR